MGENEEIYFFEKFFKVLICFFFSFLFLKNLICRIIKKVNGKWREKKKKMREWKERSELNILNGKRNGNKKKNNKNIREKEIS